VELYYDCPVTSRLVFEYFWISSDAKDLILSSCCLFSLSFETFKLDLDLEFPASDVLRIPEIADTFDKS